MYSWIVLILGVLAWLTGHPVAGLVLAVLSGHWLTLILLIVILALLHRETNPVMTCGDESSPLTVREPPMPAQPPDYGLSKEEYPAWAGLPNIHGTPHADEAGRTLACMLASMRIRSAHVFLGVSADVDAIVVSGRTIHLLKAACLTPSEDGMFLVPTPGLGAGMADGRLRVYDRNVNLNVPVEALAPIAPVRTYDATGGPARVVNLMRARIPGADIRPVILLTRTACGVYGLMGDVEYPGRIPVTQADRWPAGFLDMPADPNILESVRRLTEGGFRST